MSYSVAENDSSFLRGKSSYFFRKNLYFCSPLMPNDNEGRNEITANVVAV